MGLFSAQIAPKQIVPVCRQLSTTYNAGIPILRGLELASAGTRQKRLREVLTTMRDDIRNGATLEQAARRHTKYLPRFFVELLASGEEGGRLDIMLRDLAEYYEDRVRMKREVVKSMLYPAFLLVCAWFIGGFALRIVGQSFSSFGELEQFVVDYLIFQAKALGVVLGIVLVMALLSRKGLFSYVWGLFATHVWPVSNVTIKFALARFFRSFSLLLGSGLRMDRCIKSAAAVTANPYIQQDLLKAVPHVMNGETLVEAFAGSKFLTPLAREMLLTGEEAGSLESQMHKVAEVHQAEAAHALHVASRVLEVTVILSVACLIGFIVIKFWTGFYGGLMDELGI